MNKKILNILLLFVFAPFLTMAAGRIAEIWSQPAVFVADEEVTFFFNVSGTDLADTNEDIYLWAWFPSEPDAGNGANSSDFAKLTQVKDNVWKITMIPTEYFGVEANNISEIYGLLKTKNFGKQTDAFAPDSDPANHIALYSLQTIKGDDAILDFYPKHFSQDRPLSILINANNTWSDCETSAAQGKLAGAPDVRMHGGVNGWDIQVMNNAENKSKTTLTHLGDGIYRKDIIINDYFGLAENYTVTGINMVFADQTWAYQGKGENCADFYIEAPEIPDAPIPALYLFPSKFSANDIFVIVRKDNETNVSALNYKITAGTKTISGSFEGNNKEFSAYINLVDELAGTKNIESINVVVTDNTGRKVFNSDIPLVQLND